MIAAVLGVIVYALGVIVYAFHPFIWYLGRLGTSYLRRGWAWLQAPVGGFLPGSSWEKQVLERNLIADRALAEVDPEFAMELGYRLPEDEDPWVQENKRIVRLNRLLDASPRR